MTDNLTVEQKAELFDWIWGNTHGHIQDAIMDYMYTDRRDLHDLIYPPDEEEDDYV